MVPGEGLEPSRRETWDFKSHASAIPPPGHIHFSYLLYIYYIIIFLKNQIDFLWWGEKESNLRRLDLQSNALPTELSPHICSFRTIG